MTPSKQIFLAFLTNREGREGVVDTRDWHWLSDAVEIALTHFTLGLIVDYYILHVTSMVDKTPLQHAGVVAGSHRKCVVAQGVWRSSHKNCGANNWPYPWWCVSCATHSKLLSPSDPHPLYILTVYFGILSDIFIHFIWHIFWHSSLSGILSDISSCILFDIYSDILSGILSDILSGICSGPGVPHCIRGLQYGSGPLVPTVPTSWQKKKKKTRRREEEERRRRWGEGGGGRRRRRRWRRRRSCTCLKI